LFVKMKQFMFCLILLSIVKSYSQFAPEARCIFLSVSAEFSKL